MRMNSNTARCFTCPICGTECFTLANRQVFCSLKCRVMSQVCVGEECWTWVGAKDRDGYGRLRWKYTELGAHVAMWMSEHNLTTKPNHCVLHSCDNPSCVNPNHLWAGSQNDNVQDRHRKGRTKANPNSGDNGRRSARNNLGRFICAGI